MCKRTIDAGYSIFGMSVSGTHHSQVTFSSNLGHRKEVVPFWGGRKRRLSRISKRLHVFRKCSKLHVLVLMVLIAVPVFSQSRPCTDAEDQQVEKEAVTLRTWDSLYKSYKRYGHCDDVDAAEGYSESIARILADHWETLPHLAQLIQHDEAFGRFVGLDGTMNVNDLTKIKRLSTAHCPVGLKELCAKLRHDADNALAEDTGATAQ